MSQVCCTQSPCPCGRPLLTLASARVTQSQVWLSLCGISGSWCTQGFVWTIQDLWWVMLGPLLCPWMWGIFVVVVVVVVVVGIQHFPVDGCLATSCSFGVLLGADECMSFYFTILCVSWKCVVNTILNWKKKISRLKYQILSICNRIFP